MVFDSWPGQLYLLWSRCADQLGSLAGFFIGDLGLFPRGGLY